MEQMASRPFAGVAVELDAQLLVISNQSENGEQRKKVGSSFKNFKIINIFLKQFNLIFDPTLSINYILLHFNLQCHPTPIALEPCSGGKAAVLSLIVRLPPGDGQYTPPGQSGLGIASALVSLGTLCKGNDVIKETSKLDSWKTSSNSSTCI